MRSKNFYSGLGLRNPCRRKPFFELDGLTISFTDTFCAEAFFASGYLISQIVAFRNNICFVMFFFLNILHAYMEFTLGFGDMALILKANVDIDVLNETRVIEVKLLT